jgi:hypothetical protein
MPYDNVFIPLNNLISGPADHPTADYTIVKQSKWNFFYRNLGKTYMPRSTILFPPRLIAQMVRIALDYWGTKGQSLI